MVTQKISHSLLRRKKSAGCDVHLRALIGSGSHDNDDDDYDASGLDSPASIATYILD